MQFPKPTRTKNKKGINLFPKVKTRREMEKELDRIVALQVKERDDWTCRKCKRPFDRTEKGVGRSLQCSHYFKRELRNTRWNLDNLDSLCGGCHMQVESDKQGWYTEYMKEKLGEEALAKLAIKAYSREKVTTNDIQNMLLVESLKGNL